MSYLKKVCNCTVPMGQDVTGSVWECDECHLAWKLIRRPYQGHVWTPLGPVRRWWYRWRSRG